MAHLATPWPHSISAYSLLWVTVRPRLRWHVIWLDEFSKVTFLSPPSWRVRASRRHGFHDFFPGRANIQTFVVRCHYNGDDDPSAPPGSFLHHFLCQKDHWASAMGVTVYAAFATSLGDLQPRAYLIPSSVPLQIPAADILDGDSLDNFFPTHVPPPPPPPPRDPPPTPPSTGPPNHLPPVSLQSLPPLQQQMHETCERPASVSMSTGVSESAYDHLPPVVAEVQIQNVECTHSTRTGAAITRPNSTDPERHGYQDFCCLPPAACLTKPGSTDAEMRGFVDL